MLALNCDAVYDSLALDQQQNNASFESYLMWNVIRLFEMELYTGIHIGTVNLLKREERRDRQHGSGNCGGSGGGGSSSKNDRQVMAVKNKPK